MASLSTIQIIGNLGRDPETRFTPAGRQVTSFSVAVSRNVPSNDGTRKEETEWFRVSCWGKMAETAEQFLQKGRRVYVSGRFSSRQFQGNDGQTRTSLDVSADQLVLLDSAQRADIGDLAPSGARSSAAPVSGGYTDDISDDDIPF